MFHKTTNSMERRKLSIPVWLIIVSVVSAFLVLLVIIAILIKVSTYPLKWPNDTWLLLSILYNMKGHIQFVRSA